jgi:hypothetical protein
MNNSPEATKVSLKWLATDREQGYVKISRNYDKIKT